MCPDPGVPSDGKRLNNSFQEGKTVIFECNRDLDLVGNDTIRCEGERWSGEVPKCRGSSNQRPKFTLAPGMYCVHCYGSNNHYPYLRDISVTLFLVDSVYYTKYSRYSL